MEKVKGVVEKVWTNSTKEGKRYNVLQIDGKRYSLWDGEYFDKIDKGQEIEFEYKESGKFKNISKIYDGSEPEPSNDFDGNGRGFNGERLDKMIKMSCIKSASNLFSGSRIPFDERAERALEIAKKFKMYIDEDEFEPDSLDPVDSRRA